MGFENLRVTIVRDEAGPIIAAEYENRRFNRDELDALGVVMGVVALHATDSIARMRVTIRRVDLPVMTVESGVDAFVAFVNYRLAAELFAGQLVITNPARAGAAAAVVDDRSADIAAGAVTPRSNPSRWKVDLFLRPRIETMVLTELGVVDARVALLPDAYMQLGQGFVLNARTAIPIGQTRGYAEGLEDPNADRLLLHKAMRVPLGGVDQTGQRDQLGRVDTSRPWASALTQFSVGRFGHHAVGIANELDLSLAAGRVSLGSTLAVFGSSLGHLTRTLALANARIRFPEWDLTTALTAGRFRNGDNGAVAEVSRFFGATELAFFFRSTTFQSMAGVKLGIPLTPARELAPSRVRLRLPDLHTQQLQSTVLNAQNVLRRDVGRLLDSDHELGLVYRTRDRLQPATLGVHVETLRDAARRWLGRAILTQ